MEMEFAIEAGSKPFVVTGKEYRYTRTRKGSPGSKVSILGSVGTVVSESRLARQEVSKFREKFPAWLAWTH